MKNFEILEHTADLKIKARGKTLAELFINAALAIAQQQNPHKTEQKNEGKWEKISITSADISSLLIDWLNEILSLSDINNKIYTKFKIETLSDNRIEAKIKGGSFTKKNIEIKAATYHEASVKQVNDHWEAFILFDI